MGFQNAIYIQLMNIIFDPILGKQRRKGGLLYTTLADDAELSVATGKTGHGIVIAGDSEEYVHFFFASDGTVTLAYNSANVVNTDTDANLCIYNNSGTVSVKNRLGAEKDIRYFIDCA